MNGLPQPPPPPKGHGPLYGLGCFLAGALLTLFVGAVVVGGCALVFVSNGTEMFDGGAGVAVLEITDEIADERPILDDLKELVDDPNTRALLVRVDSPGGVITVVEEVFNALRRVADEEDLPVIASMGTMAASGGYFVCLPADRIFADNTTLTGSIGVIVEYTTAKELLDKVGVRFEQIKSGEFKGAGSLGEPLTEAQRQQMQSVVDEFKNFFVDMVSQERGLDRAAVQAIADGRVLTGKDAVALGLVDEIGDMHAAVQYAGEQAGLGDNPRLIRVRHEMPLFPGLFGQIESVAAKLRRTGPTPKYVLR